MEEFYKSILNQKNYSHNQLIIMRKLKVTCWNIKHMKRLIQPNLSDNNLKRRDGVRDQLLQMNPDILCIIEGPNSEIDIDTFTRNVLNDTYSAVKSENGEYGIKGTQWMWFLVKNELLNNCSLLPIDTWYEFTSGKNWEVNYWGHFEKETHSHYRLPQVLIMDIDGQRVEFINVHFKSKYVNSGQSDWNAGGERRETFIKNALKARIKMTTEATDVRRYIDTKFEQVENPAIFVLGDMNDGPGKEFFENQFLFFDLISNIQGDIFSADKFLNHGLFDFSNSLRWSAEFDDFVTGENNKKILLDHIMFTQSLVNWQLNVTVEPNSGYIEHEIHDLVNSLLNSRQKTSDHKPVSIELSIR